VGILLVSSTEKHMFLQRQLGGWLLLLLMLMPRDAAVGAMKGWSWLGIPRGCLPMKVVSQAGGGTQPLAVA
jgi:hypothetical protein